MAPTPRAVLLDALGTLVDLEDPARHLRGILAERFGVQVSAAQAAAGLRAEMAFYREHLGLGRDRESLLALRRVCAEVLRRALPDSPGLEEVSPPALTEALLAALRFVPFPDAAPALEAWRAWDLRLVVVSNWDISLHDVLAGVGLRPLLDGVVTSAEAGVAKPDRGIFEQALNLVRARPEEALHVGDRMLEDVEGARAAGVEAVLLDRSGGGLAQGHQGGRPPRIVRSLAELLAAS